MKYFSWSSTSSYTRTYIRIFFYTCTAVRIYYFHMNYSWNSWMIPVTSLAAAYFSMSCLVIIIFSIIAAKEPLVWLDSCSKNIFSMNLFISAYSEIDLFSCVLQMRGWNGKKEPTPECHEPAVLDLRTKECPSSTFLNNLSLLAAIKVKMNPLKGPRITSCCPRRRKKQMQGLSLNGTACR
jgi:hypothetical protein